MTETVVAATLENLSTVLSFVEEELIKFNCPPKAAMQIALAAEEIFVNIASYAYNPEVGNATISLNTTDNPRTVEMVFTDKGVPYNPLQKEDPDTTATLAERPIGGLGILMVKKSMDSVEYENKDGNNILTIRKKCL